MQIAISEPNTNTTNRPLEYRHAIEELKKSFVKSIEIVNKLRDLGVKYGLSPMEVRKDIEIALNGIVKPRQLRSILPLELKRKYHSNSNKNTNSAAAAELRNAIKPFQFSGKIVRYSRGRHCIIISDKTDVRRFEGKTLNVAITIDE
jgi:hypothetical protein